VVDIYYEKNASLGILCGFNLFKQFSQLHVFGDATVPVFNPTNNEWRDGTGFFRVRTNLTVAGTPLNQSTTIAPSCSPVTVLTPCGISGSTALNTYSVTDYTGTQAALIANLDSVWSKAIDTTKVMVSRLSATHNFYEMTRIILRRFM
jgi:hypothetical protein